ncbi:glycoside hydrolase family 43 protein [Enterococcus sp.]|uniref:glycoside hydrolase family 43 protein n=1 Tax=Enterococcus sp. TaxID=35783 RepID=UPI0025BCDA04|nr:glycoside hydrolase family 43 protein [Enterococcus sp.]
MKNKGIIWALVLAVPLLSSCRTADETLVDDFTAIIDNDGADPWIFQDDTYYYYTKTTGNNLTLWRSESLTEVAVGEEKIIWEMPAEFESIWAPELHQLDGTWVVYFAANHPSETHRMYALVNENQDPYSGDWQLEEIKGMDDKFAIDGTVLELDEQRYFLWSGWEGYENIAQNIYIAEMVSPTEVTGEKQLISVPEYEWEMRQKPLINEAPQVIIKGNTVNVMYSASGSWDNDYALGLLTMDRQDNPLDAQSWTKEAEPIFQQTETVFGPGHNGFAKSKDGTEDWLIFHAARWDHSGWQRSIRLQPIAWVDDKPQLKVPLGDNEVQKLPSGEAKRLRLAASDAILEGDLTTANDEESLMKTVVQGFEATEDRLIFQPTIQQAGKATVIVYLKTQDYFSLSEPIYVQLKTDNESQRLAVYPSQYYQPIQTHLDLAAGKVQIEVSSEIGVDTLLVDRMEIIPHQGQE